MEESLRHAMRLFLRNGIRPGLGTTYTTTDLEDMGRPLGLRPVVTEAMYLNRWGEPEVTWIWTNAAGEQVIP